MSWVFLDEHKIEKAFEKDSKEKDYLMSLSLTLYKQDTVAASSVLLYNILSNTLNMRAFALAKIIFKKEGDNKTIEATDFKFEALKKLYLSGKNDIPEGLLLFNNLFVASAKKEVVPIENYGQVVKLTSTADYVRPDLSYKLALHSLNISKEVELEGEGKKIIVLQDCTYSMRKHIDKLRVLKGFILHTALENGFNIEWLSVSDRIIKETTYTPENIEKAEMSFVYSGVKLDTTSVLTRDRFMNALVVIITDGTDNFNFKFNTKTRKINIISFRDNINIKNKLANYGRFFRFF